MRERIRFIHFCPHCLCYKHLLTFKNICMLYIFIQGNTFNSIKQPLQDILHVQSRIVKPNIYLSGLCPILFLSCWQTKIHFEISNVILAIVGLRHSGHTYNNPSIQLLYHVLSPSVHASLVEHTCTTSVCFW